MRVMLCLEWLQVDGIIQSVQVTNRRKIVELQSTARHSQYTTEHILAMPTQKGIHHLVMPLNLHYCIDHIHLNLQHSAGS